MSTPMQMSDWTIKGRWSDAMNAMFETKQNGGEDDMPETPTHSVPVVPSQSVILYPPIKAGLDPKCN